MDWIPVLSQAKSVVQLISGDREGARETQENFIRQCPIVSQGTSLTQEYILKDKKAANETRQAFSNKMSNVADGIPVVGHVKGVVHYACGDKEKGHQSMKSSSRSIGVLGGAVGGFLVGGPIGVAAGGIAGGAAMDGITTGIDSAVHKEYRPAGHIATVTDMIKSNKNPSGKIFDLTVGIALDGLAGQAIVQTAGLMPIKHTLTQSTLAIDSCESNNTSFIRRREVLEWFNGLQTGIKIEKECEIMQLVQLRNQIDVHLKKHPKFLVNATRYALFMLENSSSEPNLTEFCAYIKFFEKIFFQPSNEAREETEKSFFSSARDEFKLAGDL